MSAEILTRDIWWVDEGQSVSAVRRATEQYRILMLPRTDQQFQVSFFPIVKCKQKLCQRTKDIKASGDCSVCEDVIRTVINLSKT